MKIPKQEITKEDILSHWQQGKTKLDWRPLTTFSEKREWLQACLSWSDLPRQRIISSYYIIDGNQVTLDLDFYCLLGETFFGYRGYFGQDVGGFEDCFREIGIFVEPTVEKGARVILKNTDQIKKVLNEDLFSVVLEIFKSNGFDIELD